MVRAAWVENSCRAVALLVAALVAGCGGETECQRACARVHQCEQLAITVEQCDGECEHQPLDCQRQIECVLRSSCETLRGCFLSYPCTLPSLDDDP